MSIQDPISDMLTRIRNAQSVSKKEVAMPTSKVKLAIAKVLLDEGYISNFKEESVDEHKTMLVIELKYYDGTPVIEKMSRVSRPSLRVYKSADELPIVNNGLGIAIVSTSKGVMTASSALKAREGGEVLCYVS